MYRATFKGKELLLSNKDYKQILRRFNLKNFKVEQQQIVTKYTLYKNSTPCPLCERYNEDGCERCTFEKLTPKDGGSWSEGCMLFMVSALDYNMEMMPDIVYDEVSYEDWGDLASEHDKESIRRIYNLFLTKFKKVEDKEHARTLRSRLRK